MADDLLFVYSSPGPVDLAEFTDWYDNEHVPARLATPGFSAVSRFRALDGLLPDWLATYEIKPGTLDTPAYQAVWDNASPREKQLMSSVSALDRRVYSLLSDSWADGVSTASGPPPVVMAVSMSVPPSVEPDLAAYYEQEHYPLTRSRSAGLVPAEPCFQLVGPLAKGPSGSVSVSRQLATDSSNRARLS